MTSEALEQQLEARDPDVRLMLQVRDDVQGAFETLVERYQHRLVGVLGHLVGRSEEAEDLAQDVFLRIYRARKGYRPRAKFSPGSCHRQQRGLELSQNWQNPTVGSVVRFRTAEFF